MARHDPFVAFKEAFDEQQLEIERLFARVSKLEEMNSEVLTLVKKTGNLPDLLEYQSKAPSPVISQREMEPISCLHSQTVRSNILSDIVTQQTRGLDKALESLGLDPDRRTRILNQIQTNVNSILTTHLTTQYSHNMNEGATYPTGHSIISPTSAPSIDGSWNTSAAASSGDGSLPRWRASLETSPLIDQTPRYHPGAGFLESTSSNLANTSLGPASLREDTAYSHIQAKRKLELLRINQRAPTIPSPVGWNGPLSHPQQFPPASVAYQLFSSEAASMPSSQLSRGMIQVPDHTATEYAFAHPISTLHDLAAVSSREAIPNTAPTKTNLGTRGTEQLCICGNKLSCPLSLVKQRRLGTNPRVQRGFIRLAAVFRGRFVRQLLATHKVYDLIRTIKDTAKLALSIHVERKASHTLKRAESQNAEIASPQPTTDSDQLPDEELILEARLLAQLRGSLNQLHEIFFSWPLSNQIDLLRVSRSLPHRNKRVTTHPEDLRHNAHVCDAACDEWPQRCATEQRRPWGSVATHGECKEIKQDGDGQTTHVLRPLQLDQADRLSSQVVADESAKEKNHIPSVQPRCAGLRKRPQTFTTGTVGRLTTRTTGMVQQQQTSLCRTRKIAAGSHRTPEFDSRGGLHSCAPVHSAISEQTASRISVPCDAKENCPLPCSKPNIGSRISIRSTQVVTTAATGTPRHRAQSNHKQCGQRNIQSPKSVSAASSSVALQRGRTTPLHSSRNNHSATGIKEKRHLQNKTCESKGSFGSQHRPQDTIFSEAETTGSINPSAVLVESQTQSGVPEAPPGLSIHSKSDRFGGGATPSTLQRSQQPSARSSNMVRRPVSGPLGKARTNVTDDSQHPVRYRIISSPYPPDSSAFLSTSRRCTLQYPLYNHQSGRTTSVDARRIVSTCEEPTAGAPRRINRWGDEKFQNRNSLFEST